MSERDKKLLVYLGALLILAAAYFLVGKPYLDKLDALSTEKTQLEQTLSQKQSAYAKQGEYEQGIADANTKLNEIMHKFPEDINDEKSIMFVSHAESDVPIWFSQVKFAEEVKMMINGEETTVESEAEAEEIIADANSEATNDDGSSDANSKINEMFWRRTDLGLTFQVKYDGFKDYLAYIRDYKDRLVIKEIDVTYDELSGLVSGNMVLSQYAILGEDRVLPDVETGVDSLGTENIFTHENHGGSILDLLAGMASDFVDILMGGITSEAAQDELGTDYFIKLNASTDNTNGKTIGRGDDVAGSTHIASDKNSKEDIRFEVSGEDGEYAVKYSIGENGYLDGIKKDSDGKIYLRIISTERFSNDDNVEAAIRITNNADIPVYVNIEGDDSSNPRVSIVERNGEVTVK